MSDLVVAIRIRADGQAEAVAAIGQVARAANTMSAASQQGTDSLTGLAGGSGRAGASAAVATTSLTSESSAIDALATSAQAGSTSLGRLSSVTDQVAQPAGAASTAVRLLQMSFTEATVAAQRFNDVRMARIVEQDPHASQRASLRQRMAVVDEAFTSGAISAQEAARESAYLSERLQQISPAALQAAAALRREAEAARVSASAMREGGSVATISAGQMAQARRTIIQNLINVGTAAVVTQGNLIATLSPMPDVLYGVSQMGVGAQATARSLMVLSAGVAAVGGALAVVAVHSHTMESRTRAMTGTIRAMGDTAGVTGEKLRQMSERAAAMGPFTRTETAQAAMAVASQPGLPGSMYGKILDISVDMAVATQQDVATTAEMLAKTLSGGVEEIRKFDQAWNVLTADEARQIRVLAEHGDQLQASQTLLDAVNRRFKGLAEEGMTTFQSMMAKIGDGWSALKDKLAGPISIGKPMEITWKNDFTDKTDLQVLEQKLAEQNKRKEDMEKRIASDRGSFRESLEHGLSIINAQIKQYQEEIAALNGVSDKVAQSDEKATDALKVASKKNLDELISNYKKQSAVLRAAAHDREMIQAEQEARAEAVAKKLSPEDTESLIKERKGLVQDRRHGSVVDAVMDADLQVKAQERLLAVAGQSRRAMAMVEAGNLAAAIAAKNHGENIETLTEALQKSAMLRMDVQVAEATGAMDRQVVAAHALNTAWQSGSMAAVEYAERQAEAAQMAYDLGISYEDAAKRVGRLRDAQKAAAVAGEVIGMEMRVTNTRRVNDVLASGGDPAAVRQAQEDAAIEEMRMRYRSLSVEQEMRARATIRAAQGEQLRSDAVQFTQQMDYQKAYEGGLKKLADLKATGLITERAATEETLRLENAKLAASREWADGAQLAMREYADAASNYGRQAYEAINRSFSAMEDALTEFVTTGKLNFGNFANTIISQLVRIQVQASITGPLASMLSGMFGSSTPTAEPGFVYDGPASASEILFNAKGNAFQSGHPVQAFASGGVFTNQVVSRPTYFPMGVMGEAGEEAIMPLTRSSSGHLAVRAVGAGGSVVNINIIGGNSTPRVERASRGGTHHIDIIFEQVESYLGGRIARGDGLASTLENRYGLGVS